ncbi:MAG: DUF669 domain-containing protein [Oscillospiraceae bacterium]|nr:DUF669 domain-containing protein [Oscillospiraceae bacterium]
MALNNIDRELGWDDEIEKDSSDFVILPEGDYNFTVTGFERGRHNGSDKLPACNKAILSIKLEGAAGTTTIKHNLFLHSKCEGMLCAFFTSIGQRKKGEKLRMNWTTVTGSRGRCKVGIHEYQGRDGDTKKSNQITRFYEPEEQSSFNTAKSFTPGNF